ncbi:hypothetical protein D9M72_346280 [compost metagenome]
MVLATRLLTNTVLPSPAERKAWAPLPVGILPTSLGWAPATSNTCTPSLPVRPTSSVLSLWAPKMSAGMAPVAMRQRMVCVGRSTAISSSLSCMVT